MVGGKCQNRLDSVECGTAIRKASYENDCQKVFVLSVFDLILLIMLICVINLDRSVDRWKSVSGELQKVGVEAVRVAGVDGRKLSNEFVESIVPPLSDISSRLEFPKELTKGEVGCFLSHRKCWQKLLESKEKWALILEDDIYISRRAKKYMTGEGWIPNDAGFVQLHIHRSGKYYVRPGVIVGRTLKVPPKRTLI